MHSSKTSSERPGESLVSSVMPVKIESGRILLIDQRKLPQVIEYFDATELNDMCIAIEDMVVRGAPSIGVAGALGLAWEAKRLAASEAPETFLSALGDARRRLEATRPTAVNLRWGLDRIYGLAEKLMEQQTRTTMTNLSLVVCHYAEQMIAEHYHTNKTLSDLGAKLIGSKAGVLTHCNAGSLATCGWGTALGVILSARLKGSELTVYTAETRPRQQGMRLTAWELIQDGFEPIVITDSMVGHLMAEGKIDLVVVGADRIATNGDTANKIGTYNLAVLAHAHNIPFYIAAPLSTIDPHIKSGKEIPIEERDPDEVTTLNGQSIAPAGVKVLNPAFDVTPARLISAIITEAGILHPPYEKQIASALS